MHECGKALLDFDNRRTCFERFAIEIGKDQPGLRAEGKTNINEISFSGVKGAARFHFQMDGPLRAPPEADFAGIVGQAGLTKNRVLVKDGVGAFGFDLHGAFDQPLFDAARWLHLWQCSRKVP